MNKIKTHIVPILFIAALFVFMLTGGIVIKFSGSIINENSKIAQVSMIYEIIEEIRITLRSVIISQRDYLIMGENEYYLDYLSQKKHLLDEMERLRKVETGKYINKKELIFLIEMIGNKLPTLDEMIDLGNHDKIGEVEKLIEEKSNPIFDRIQTNASKIENTLEKIIAEFRISSQRYARIVKISIYTGYSIAFLLLFISFFSLQRQIIRRKMAENELKNKTRILTELNIEKDKFFSILAHDLKNPFTALLGLMDLLKDSIDKQDINEIKELIGLLDASCRKTYYLLQNLLEWARIQTGRLTPSFEIINIHDVIEETYQLLEDSVTHKKIKLTLPEKNQVLIHADKNMILTVFRNILSNSIKFTPEEGRIEINIQIKKADVIVSITDTGCGIKQDEIPMLFRLDTDTRLIGKGINKGTGLGLILAKELMRVNKGDIWAESEFGKGSTFFISVPKFMVT